MGLKKYGKGDWRNISRNFVVTRTPTQVASHAQKYFIRQLSGGKDKRRASIHDITTVNLNDTRSPSPENKKSVSPEHSTVLPRHSNPSSTVARTTFNWNHHHQQQQHNTNGAAMVFNHSNGNVFMSPSAFSVNSYAGLRLPEHHLQKGAVNEPFIGPQNMIFQMQAGHCFPHG